MGENYSTKMYDSRFLRVNNYYFPSCIGNGELNTTRMVENAYRSRIGFDVIILNVTRIKNYKEKFVTRLEAIPVYYSNKRISKSALLYV